MAIDTTPGSVNELVYQNGPNPERYSREHNMRKVSVAGGNQAYPKHELLNLAHERGLVGIRVQPIGPVQEDEYIYMATVTFSDGTVFTDVGDASPRNTQGNTAKALPRMAATRAISRALALALNADANVDAEFGGDDEASPRPQRQSAPAQQRRNTNYAPSSASNDEWEDE